MPEMLPGLGASDAQQVQLIRQNQLQSKAQGDQADYQKRMLQLQIASMLLGQLGPGGVSGSSQNLLSSLRQGNAGGTGIYGGSSLGF